MLVSRVSDQKKKPAVFPSYWIVVGASLAAAAIVGTAFFWRRGRSADPRKALKAVAIEQLRDVLVPDSMGGQIYLEHVLMTAHGIVVIDVKNVVGVIFASDLMNDWTVIGARGRFTLQNPQGNLYNRVAAVRQLVDRAPVTGYVLFPLSADFSKGRPRDVVLPAELIDMYAAPDHAEAERLKKAFASDWRRIREVAVPAHSGGP